MAEPRQPGVVLQNEDAAPPALLGDWLRERGLSHRTVRVWESGVPEDPREFGWVASLGAEDSVTQSEPAWVPAEVEFLRRAVDADVPVLGLCFGGQALSVALGGEVSPAEPPSIGWFEIETDDPDLVPGGPWVHFNVESLSVPAGAEQLARSPRGPGAFRLGPHLGLQFHPEATPAVVNGWSNGEAARLATLGIDPDDIRAQGERWGAQAARGAFELFDAWRQLAPARA
ncbi:MAG: type 1 glutamine amidotransferase [Solirubrobacterales bacterium]